MTASAFITQQEASYRYSFTRQEASAAIGIEGHALSMALNRAVKTNRIVALRRNFYLVLPAPYQDKKYLPVPLYIDELCNAIRKRYYVAVHSAALRHGASHQALMEDYVMLEYPGIKDISKGNFRLNFLASVHWPHDNIIRMKSNAGYYYISDPALTMADLIHYQNKIGGYNRVFTLIHELAEGIDIKSLVKLCSWYPYNAVIQRLGYMMSLLEVDEKILQVLRDHLSTSPIFPVLLVDQSSAAVLETVKPWMVEVNAALESDL